MFILILADIVAVLKQIPHPHFSREGQNIVYRHAITLEKALTGSTVSIPLLAGRSVNVSLQEIIRYFFPHLNQSKHKFVF